jgi:hypothetical protein
MFVKDFVKKDVPQTSSNHICSLLSANTILFLLSFFPFSFLFFFFFFEKKKNIKKMRLDHGLYQIGIPITHVVFIWLLIG